MRYFITLGLALCSVGSAAAQTEVIIRRPGEKDQVIHLDSSAARAEIARLEVEAELHKATLAMQGGLQEMGRSLASQQGAVALHQSALEASQVLRQRSNSAEMMARQAFGSLERNLAAIRRQARLGVTIAYDQRDTDKYGAYVTAVTPGSPAEKAGIVSGDVITRIAGKSLGRDAKSTEGDFETSPGFRLTQIMSTLEAGKPVDVELRRGTRSISVKATPIEDISLVDRGLESPSLHIERLQPRTVDRRSMSELSSAQGNTLFSGSFGGVYYSFTDNGLFSDLELAPINEKLGSYFGTTEGVLVVNTSVERPTVLQTWQGDTVRVEGRGGMGGSRAGSVSRQRPDTAAALFINGVPLQKGITRKANPFGLEPGDVVVSVDGRKVTSPSQLIRIVGTYERGDDVKLQIMRQKHAETLTAKML